MGAGQAQNKITATGENKTAVETSLQAKPEVVKAVSTKTGSPDETGKVIPTADTTKKPARSAASKALKVKSGIIAWSGSIEKNSVLVIAPPIASIGKITGVFPGKPVSIEVEPREVVIRQMPVEANGYKQLMLYSGSNKFTSITIRWTTIQ
jgi:hypothetical protein